MGFRSSVAGLDGQAGGARFTIVLCLFRRPLQIVTAFSGDECWNPNVANRDFDDFFPHRSTAVTDGLSQTMLVGETSRLRVTPSPC